MTEMEKAQAKAWVENWKKTGPILESQRHRELREYDYEKNRLQALGLLELGYRFRRPRPITGMVEMQRIFMKARP